jgi:hypothetical protein
VKFPALPPFPSPRQVSKIMSVCNCNAAVALVERWGTPLVNLGGIDVADGRKMATLSLVGGVRVHLKRLKTRNPKTLKS